MIPGYRLRLRDMPFQRKTKRQKLEARIKTFQALALKHEKLANAGREDFWKHRDLQTLAGGRLNAARDELARENLNTLGAR